MPHEVRDRVIREAFLDAVRSEGVSVQKVRDLANNTQDFETRNLMLALGKGKREVYSVSGIGLVYVRIKSDPPGWWNIMESVEKHFVFLSELQIHCYYIFLLGRKDLHIADGYIATDINQPPFIRRPTIESGKYSVTERQHLNPNRRLSTISRVARTLIQQGSTPSPLFTS